MNEPYDLLEVYREMSRQRSRAEFDKRLRDKMLGDSATDLFNPINHILQTINFTHPNDNTKPRTS